MTNSSNQTDYWTASNPNSLNDYDDGLPTAWINHKPQNAPIIFQNKSLTMYHFPRANMNKWIAPDWTNWT